MPFGYTNHRRSIRLSLYDYASQGVYFVTICSYGKWPIFGKIINDDMRLNAWGTIVRDEWLRSADLRHEIQLDKFVVMPDHMHGIVIIKNDQNTVGATGRSPLHDAHQPCGPAKRSLGSMVGGFKSAVTQRINILRHSPGVPVWQRNYYESVIRNKSELNRIRQYILDNPKNWDNDKLNISKLSKTQLPSPEQVAKFMEGI